jgi:hypothetical protein
MLHPSMQYRTFDPYMAAIYRRCVGALQSSPHLSDAMVSACAWRATLCQHGAWRMTRRQHTLRAPCVQAWVLKIARWCRCAGVAINFVRNDDIRILRDIEQYYSTQIDEMVSCCLL